MIKLTLSKLSTIRFGEIEYEDADRITFQNGIVGFPNLQSFLILNVKEGSPFRWLQSIDDPSFAMLMSEPLHFLKEYDPTIQSCDQQLIELTPGTTPLRFVTVSIPAGRPQEMTLNLSGPIIINPINRKAIQVVLSEDSYTSKHRVFPETTAGVQASAA